MSQLRIALFVEGSLGERKRDGGDWFLHLWQSTIVQALGLRSIDMVVPISKGNLAAMHPNTAKLKASSSTGVRLDQIMAQRLKLKPAFDAAIIAWDLHPAWQPSVDFCRWEETLRLYRLLASSKELPSLWTTQAANRLSELTARALPSARSNPPILQPGSVLALCMAPEFESLLVNESGFKTTLGLKGKQMLGWPRDWDAANVPQPKALLQKALSAARKTNPRPKAFQAIHGDMETSKHEWASFLLTHGSAEFIESVRTHPTGQRLQELLPRR